MKANELVEGLKEIGPETYRKEYYGDDEFMRDNDKLSPMYRAEVVTHIGDTYAVIQYTRREDG